MDSSTSAEPDSIASTLEILAQVGDLPGGYLIGIAFIFLIASILFSLAEGALLAFSPTKLQERFGAGSEKKIDMYSGSRDHMVVSSVIVDSTCNVCFVACMTLWVMSHWTGNIILGALTAILSSIIILIPLGEILPRSWGYKNSTPFLARSLPMLHALSRILLPLINGCNAVNRAILRAVGRPETDDATLFADAIQSVVDTGEQQGVLEEDAREMIESIIDFTDVDVKEIKTPRTETDCIHADATIEEVVQFIIEKKHSRIPVYEDTRDTIIGVVYAKDLFPHWNSGESLTARQLMRKPLFIPETKPALDLLREMRIHHTQLAIILDEYGGTDGIITIEDLLEEIVGEIEDEYDETETVEPFVRIDEHRSEVDAAYPIEELAEELAIPIPENEHYETVGGFLFNEMGRIPAVGDEFQYHNATFRILDAEARKINRIQIHIQNGK